MKVMVRVKTGSRQEKVEEIEAGIYKVSVTARPVEGEANRAVQKILADHFGIAKSNIELIKGQKSKVKVFNIIK